MHQSQVLKISTKVGSRIEIHGLFNTLTETYHFALRFCTVLIRKPQSIINHFDSFIYARNRHEPQNWDRVI